MASKGRCVAVCAHAVARIVLDEDGESACVSVQNGPIVRLEPPCAADTFVAAKRHAMFYGATRSGALLVVVCNAESLSFTSWARRIEGYYVTAVIAACDLNAVVVGSDMTVRIVDLKNRRVTIAGRISSPSRRPVAAFASGRAVGFVTAKSSDKAFSVVTLKYDRHVLSWPDIPTQNLNSPEWASCCACEMFMGLMTIFVGGALLASAQVHKNSVTGAEKFRSKYLLTARSSKITSICILESGAVLCLLANGALVSLREGNHAHVLFRNGVEAVADTGDVCTAKSPRVP